MQHYKRVECRVREIIFRMFSVQTSRDCEGNVYLCSYNAIATTGTANVSRLVQAAPSSATRPFQHSPCGHEHAAPSLGCPWERQESTGGAFPLTSPAARFLAPAGLCTFACSQHAGCFVPTPKPIQGARKQLGILKSVFRHKFSVMKASFPVEGICTDAFAAQSLEY